MNEIINAESASKAENIGQLPEEWLSLIFKNKWFKLFVQKDLNGLGLTLPEVLRKEEELAEMDGSLGWTITLCAGASWFVGFLNQDLAKEIFTDPKVCLAGSGFVGGEANLVNGEYHINGSWTYASGALHATHFTANCKMLADGKAVLDELGNQLVKAFILKKEEVKILDGWSYMGMIATGSHSFKVDDIKVPFNRSFEIEPEKAILKNPVYQYPFLQLAETTLAVNVLGITKHFLKLVDDCFWIRNENRNYSEEHLNFYKTLFDENAQYILNAKKEFYDCFDQSWKELTENGEITISTLNKVSNNSRHLAIACRKASAALHPYAGLEAAKKHTEINRVWRDMNTVSQHALLIFPF
ncbi:MAG: acyl-CoA dehydrogenase [Pelobium sp.]